MIPAHQTARIFRTTAAPAAPTPVWERRGIGSTLADTTFFQSIRLRLADDRIDHPYSQHPWVYAAVRTIATALQGLPFRLGRDFTPIEDPENPWLATINRVNPHSTQSQLWEATSIHLDTTGESFWVLLDAAGNPISSPEEVPWEIWPYSGAFFEHEVDESKQVSAWILTAGHERTPLEPHQVMHFKLLDPRQPIRGLPPLHAAFMSVRQDFKASLFNEAFFTNGAEPGGYIKAAEDIVDPESVRQIIEKHEARHRGANNANRVRFFGAGMEFVWAPVRHRDMEFRELRQQTLREILAVYGLTEFDVGMSDNVNRATALTAEKRFYTKVILPRARYIESVINDRISQTTGFEGVFGFFDTDHIEALRDGFSATVEQAMQLYTSGFASRNEVNERFDLGFEADDEFGDVRFVPNTVSPIDMAFAEPEEDDPFEDVDDTDDEDDHQDDDEQASALGDGEAADAVDEPRYDTKDAPVWKTYIQDRFGRLEDRFARSMLRHLNGLGRRTIKNLRDLAREQGASATETPTRARRAGIEFRDIERVVFDMAGAERRLRRRVAPLYTAIGDRTADLLRQELAGLDEFNVRLPEAEALIRIKINKVVGINTTMRNDIVRFLVRQIREKRTIKEIAKGLQKRFGANAMRSLRIARTETAQTVNSVRQLAHKKAGVERHQWVTAADEAVRDTHAAQDGVVVNVGELFPNGIRFPADPDGPAREVINCRCVALPVGKGRE